MQGSRAVSTETWGKSWRWKGSSEHPWLLVLPYPRWKYALQCSLQPRLSPLPAALKDEEWRQCGQPGYLRAQPASSEAHTALSPALPHPQRIGEDPQASKERRLKTSAGRDMVGQGQHLPQHLVGCLWITPPISD